MIPGEPPSGGASPEARALPEPTFAVLVAGIAAQAQVALGLLPHPVTKQTSRDPAAARHAIALLSMLEAKTQGNLDADEARFLGAILYELRMSFVRIAP